MKSRYFLTILLSALLLHVYAAPGLTCVGRTLTIAHNGSIDQKVMSSIMAVFIQERTGTEISLVDAGDVDKSKKMVEEEKADIFLSYLNKGLADMDGKRGENTQENYSMVKQYYLQEKGMVWLKPFGYKGPVTANETDAAVKSLAVAVANKSTLERFPILERVINKLDDVFDENTLKQIKDKSDNGDMKAVVKEFLKSRNMI